MSRSRIVVLVLVIAAVVAVSIVAVRMSSPQSTASSAATPTPSAAIQAPSASTPSPSPSPSIDPVIAWADSVCAASFDIRDTLTATGEDLAVVPGPGALDEIRGRLERRGDTIISQLQPLTIALGQVPVDVPEALRLASTLSDQTDALSAAADRTKQSIDDLTGAGSVLDFGQALPEAITSVGEAATAAKALGTSITQAASDEGGRLGPGFRESVVCQALIAGDPG